MEYIATVSVSLLAPEEDCEEMALGIERNLRWLQDDTLLGFVWGCPGGWQNLDFSVGIEAENGLVAQQMATDYLTSAIRNSGLGIHSGLFAHALPGHSWMFEATEAASLDVA